MYSILQSFLIHKQSSIHCDIYYKDVVQITYMYIHVKYLWIFTVFLKSRYSNNYHVKNIKCFTQRQFIIWFKPNSHEAFFVFKWFIIIYYFNLSFSFFSKFCLIFNASLSLSVGVKTRYLISSFSSMYPSISLRNK